MYPETFTRDNVVASFVQHSVDTVVFPRSVGSSSTVGWFQKMTLMITQKINAISSKKIVVLKRKVPKSLSLVSK